MSDFNYDTEVVTQDFNDDTEVVTKGNRWNIGELQTEINTNKKTYNVFKDESKRDFEELPKLKMIMKKKTTS